MMTDQVLRAPQFRTAFKSADFPGHSLPLENIGCFLFGRCQGYPPDILKRPQQFSARWPAGRLRL